LPTFKTETAPEEEEEIKRVLMYGAETWTFTEKAEVALGCFNENEVWSFRYNFELYRIYQGPDIVRSIKIGRLRWLGHVMQMNANDPSKNTLLDKPIGKRKRGRPRTRYMENDLKVIGVSGWRKKASDRNE